ncbi:hypothetical protein IQ254_28820 [Nodosilinea sp. LEGE 07088]|uniref:hypothetical protein n=1 Tax=Nodosilinea sp. LEGE 07088 TaxID=2777968 RepID=UPI00188188B8|nr:hypothetical protein [Nodosilinea sp. LEGE 07088]MBE9141158.1 hypothetical protein [Nodosilinea sp. LEGE 07088]
MESSLQALRITHDELDQLTGLDISAVFMGGIIRPSAWRSRRHLLSLAITECLVLGTILIICLGK